MTRTTRRLSTASAVALCITLLGVLSPRLQAASISYGNSPVLPSGVQFLDVTESSGTDPVPLFGPPSYFVTGIDFDPQGFTSSASGGDSDITDGQLNFTVTHPQAVIGLNIFEAGDYSLAGVGTNATQALAGAIIRATVTQINNVNVPPLVLATSNASVGFNLLGNPGVAQPWSLGLALNIAGQMPPGQRATRVEISIDNTLITTSQPTSLSFIAKKEFIVRTNVVPEPTTVAMVGMALCGLGLGAVRKRS